MMSQTSFISRLRLGKEYMKQWPMRKELTPIFPENRIIKATHFGIKIMPAVAVLSVLTQFAFHNQMGLPQAVMTALFALSLPVQGLWWLGTRAQTTLSPQLVVWYHELYQKILQTGCSQEPVPQKPSYLDLANLLKRAFKQLERSDFERWF